MTDESLLTQATSGDETAFRILYERYRGVVFRFAYRLLQSSELAEEITHDCFLQLLRSPSRFDARRASLKTYLCSAARNLALKHLRDYGSESPLDEAEESATGILDAGQMHHLLQAEMVSEVRRAVAELPILQREALILFEYEEMSLAEVAAIVGADVGAVKARLARARENLRRALSGYFRGAGLTVAGK